ATLVCNDTVHTGSYTLSLHDALPISVDLASSSARRAFELSVQSVSGSLTHQIVGGSQGVPEALFTRLRTELGVRRSAPVVTDERSEERTSELQSREKLVCRRPREKNK